MRWLLVVGWLCGLGGVAAADPPAKPGTPRPRKPTDRVAEILHGPFQSSRLFAMPVADVVGAYVISVGGDGSLLEKPGVLTSDSAVAIGFGDIAQLEYRHSSVISVTGADEPVPAAGVQLKLPLPTGSGIPAIGVAFRLGVPRRELVGATDVDETVTDLYLVGRLRYDALPWLTLHAGARVSSATIKLSGDRTFKGSRDLVLPTSGFEIAASSRARIVAEIALAPRFTWTAASTADPVIGYGALGRLGLRWSVLPALSLDASLGYQIDEASAAPGEGPGAVLQWDIRIGAEVFVPWGALACRVAGTFCE